MELPVIVAHAVAVSNLEPHHQDPFERILVAQAVTELLRLLTTDKLLARYSDVALVV